MQAYKLALASALLLGTSVAYAGEKASYSGVNKDVQVLSELSSTVPGQEGHVIKQITETWKYTSPNKEFDGALGIAVDQQDIVGNQFTQKGYGMSRSTNGDETYFTFQSTGKLNGQEISGSGTWQWTGGTGKFKEVKGGGPFTYKGGPNLPFSFEWSGQAEM